ncbi:MAG: Elongation factor Ts [Parcubacteria group bacterium GW2011_GWF1_40_6]|uniref:Elongation factor Ts n=3 Tax=Candidatus Nomuraibacteriota TaxID=1752729 RepID=A0A0G0QR92_9BACT|nr:MAG: Elongation factor Ts [Candidatus Nomurabacteria bacterium GW2011_GWF2_40_12]KKR69792.1 MAG: Elongation factor Ts [Parcubacteria group bacterium GW2011_GWF1_40_6]OGJ09409.1 MAG: translation elongation factor Ts [Candidatus Nomurabacteria bacterium RIFOXYB1_FULL_39_16]OGJ15030.1 MAG: translation elongation factor Ts [Candidatus Nomurabacteria bacterium RIFOXYD1_FULL_39_12]
MSTQITTEQIKELRDTTGISVMQCKRALEEAEGDMNKALAILKKTSSDIALKKVSREVKDGRVSIKTDGKKAVLVSLHCETDFVARNEDFTKLLDGLTEKAFLEGIEKMTAEAKDMIDPIIQKTGENIQLGEAFLVSGEVIGSYVHNNKTGVIVSLTGGSTELARDIAMHVTAMRPEYISQEEITEDVKKTMREIFEKEVAGVDKPAEIKEKMLLGKMATYFKEKTLLDQSFIKDGEQTVGKLLEKAGAKIKEVKRYSI